MKQLWLNKRRQFASRATPMPLYAPIETHWQRQLHAMLSEERKRKAQREPQEFVPLVPPGIERR